MTMHIRRTAYKVVWSKGRMLKIFDVVCGRPVMEEGGDMISKVEDGGGA